MPNPKTGPSLYQIRQRMLSFALFQVANKLTVSQRLKYIPLQDATIEDVAVINNLTLDIEKLDKQIASLRDQQRKLLLDMSDKLQDINKRDNPNYRERK